LRELPSGGAGLREQLRQCVLQQLVRKQKCRFRAWLRDRPVRAARSGFDLGVFVEKPTRILAENAASISSMSAEGMRLPVSTMLR